MPSTSIAFVSSVAVVGGVDGIHKYNASQRR